MTTRILMIYLFRLNATRCLNILALVFFIIWIGQFSDLVGRFKETAQSDIGSLLMLSLMRSPTLMFEVLPHIILIGTALTVHDLAKNFELQMTMMMTRLRLRQIILPIALSAAALGSIYILIVDPIAANLMDRTGQFESISQRSSARITHEASLPLPHGGTIFVFARDVLPSKARAVGLSVFVTGVNNRLLARIEASAADMSTRPWRLIDMQVRFTTPKYVEGEHQDILTVLTRETDNRYGLNLPTETLLAEIRDPSHGSLWLLPSWIANAAKLGRQTLGFERYFHRRLAFPMLLASIAFLGAAIASSFIAREPWLRIGAQFLLTVFLLYTLFTVADALAARERISPVSAAWLPVIICFVGASFILRVKRI